MPSSRRPRTNERAEERLSYFVDRGMLEAVPSDWQLEVGRRAMMPIALSESARERTRSRRTWLGQVPIRVPLQLLYSPLQGLAGTGLAEPAGRIVRHVVSVYHEDAFLGYDLQLLAASPGGLGLLAERADEIARGRGLVDRGLRNLVGYEGYHRGLVDLAERAMRSEYPDPLDLDRRFVSLVGFARFCLALPDWPPREHYGFDLGTIRAWLP